MDDAGVRALPPVRVPALNAGLFLGTIATTLWAGSALAGQAPALAGLDWASVRAAAAAVPGALRAGAPFAAALIAILLSHEMGHYLLARRHRVDSTLPFFIPLPFGFGTLGAVIRLRSPLPSRRAVLDVGAAGPLAGFAVAVPLLLWGLAHSAVVAVDPSTLGAGAAGSPYELVQRWLAGAPLVGDEIGQVFGDSLVTWAATRLTLGAAATGPGAVVQAHPVVLAAWLGLFVTALNLVPLGQLDGGHVTYALLGGARARLASRLVSFGLFAAGVFLSWNWLVWWLLTRFLVGTRHPPALEEGEPLGPGRRAVAVCSLLLFAATFVPVPFR